MNELDERYKMGFSCTCGMCPTSAISGAFHDTAPEIVILRSELCQWHQEHGNEGLHYIGQVEYLGQAFFIEYIREIQAQGR